MELQVECEPGPDGAPEPSVVWFGSRRLPVLAILDRWYGEGQRWWKIQTDDGLYVLRHDAAGAAWVLAAVTRS